MKQQRDSFFGLHFTSIISISLVLFMAGIITMIISSARLLTIETKENIAVSIILNDDIENEDLRRLKAYISAAYFTKEVKYISKEDALKEHCEAIGEDPSDLLGFNPLNASLELYLDSKYAVLDSINNVVKPKISSFSGIKEIVFQEDIINIFNNNLHKATILISIIAIVLLLISIVLINNTIRITIYSKRFSINTMLLVGAKTSFVRAPFLRKSILNGLISSFLAIIYIAACSYYIQSELGDGFTLYHTEIIIPTLLIILSLGLLIPFLATIFSINRYVNMKANKLYFI